MPKPKNVFISWSGASGQILAEGLRDFLKESADVQVFVSSDGIRFGDPWFGSIQAALGNANQGIVCLTKGSAAAPWINFEAGFLFGALDNVKVLVLDEHPRGALESIHFFDAANDARFGDFIREVIGNPSPPAPLQSYVQAHLQSWRSTCERAREIAKTGLDAPVGDALAGILSLRRNEAAARNSLFGQVLRRTVQVTARRFSNVVESISLPVDSYPSYLIHLQQTMPDATVQAIAVVNKKELFWQSEPGHDVRRTANSQSRRVFVFWNPDLLIDYWGTLMQHAEQYAVAVLAYDDLKNRFPNYADDFSIVARGADALLARYTEGTQKLNSYVTFTSGSEEVARYRTTFEDVWKYARRMEAGTDNPRVAARKFKDAVFSTGIAVKYEMSRYIKIEDYDRHEEEHAYYREMLSVIVDAVAAHIQTSQEPKIVEFGAGTGILTRRLAELASRIPQLKIAAVEIDRDCFGLLKRVEGRSVDVHNDDSTTFGDNDAYDVVVSSFADHHIRPEARQKYYQNVLRVMKPGGAVIIGDEFLREHDITDRDAHALALLDYHGHVIDIARGKGQTTLAQLEVGALRSGLEAIGDFKMTCRELEDLLRSVGLESTNKKIGPTEGADIGGVYVFQARRTD